MSRKRDVEAFDTRASSYEQDWRGQLHRELANATVEVARARSPHPRAVLDVGCGTGYALGRLAEQIDGAELVAGIDPAPRMVAVARASVTDRRVRVLRAEVESLPFVDAAFGLVTTTTSFDHWHDQAAGLAECARVLAPGGTLVLTDLLSRLVALTTFGDRRGKARTVSSLTRLLVDAGFGEVRWSATHYVLLRTVSATRLG